MLIWNSRGLGGKREKERERHTHRDSEAQREREIKIEREREVLRSRLFGKRLLIFFVRRKEKRHLQKIFFTDCNYRS